MFIDVSKNLENPSSLYDVAREQALWGTGVGSTTAEREPSLLAGYARWKGKAGKDLAGALIGDIVNWS